MILLSHANLLPEGPILVWACVAAAGVGLAIGLRFRVPMLLAAAVVTSAVMIAVGIHSEWSAYRTVGLLILLLVIQHVSYLVGLFASARR